MMLKSGDDDDEIEDYSQHLAYRMVKRFFPIWPKLRGHAFLLNQKEVDAELAKPENSDVTIGRGKRRRCMRPLCSCVWPWLNSRMLCLRLTRYRQSLPSVVNRLSSIVP